MSDLKVARRELKYRLDAVTARLLRDRVSRVLPVDRPGPPDGYLVRSLYFDTPWDKDFHDKIDGLEVRHKIRLRIYGPGDTKVKLEEKSKRGTNQWKTSATITREQAELMRAGQYQTALANHPSPFVQHLLRDMTINCYRPKIIVEFRRLAFTHGANQTRITFDSHLTATEANLDLFTTTPHYHPIMTGTVLEVKYDRFLLSHIKQTLDLADRQTVSVSKYCLGRQTTLTGDR